MLQDYIITPGQTQLVFSTPSDSIITYSEPIPVDCHGTHYFIALRGCRRVAVWWVRERLRTLRLHAPRAQAMTCSVYQQSTQGLTTLSEV